MGDGRHRAALVCARRKQRQMRGLSAALRSGRDDVPLCADKKRAGYFVAGPLVFD